jgi:hypothetical protein
MVAENIPVAAGFSATFLVAPFQRKENATPRSPPDAKCKCQMDVETGGIGQKESSDTVGVRAIGPV